MIVTARTHAVIPEMLPSGKCKLRPFGSLSETKLISVRLHGEYGVLMEGYQCRVATCGNYHLRFVRNLFKMRGISVAENMLVLKKFALGLRGPEIGKDLGINRNIVAKRMQEMCARSGAISREQLLAVSIWTGIINII